MRSWRGKRGLRKQPVTEGKKRNTLVTALEGKAQCETLSIGLPLSLSPAILCISLACWPLNFLRMHKKSLLLFLAIAVENTCGWTIPDWLRSTHRLRWGHDIKQHHRWRIPNRSPWSQSSFIPWLLTWRAITFITFLHVGRYLATPVSHGLQVFYLDLH